MFFEKKGLEALKKRLQDQKSNIGAIVKSKELGGKTICRDSLYSTSMPSAGVCSWHGGWADGKKAVVKKAAAKEVVAKEVVKTTENHFRTHTEGEPCYLSKSTGKFFVGAATVEYIQKALLLEGIRTSVKVRRVIPSNNKSPISSWAISPNPRKKFKDSDNHEWFYEMFVGSESEKDKGIKINHRLGFKEFLCTEVDKAIDFFAQDLDNKLTTEAKAKLQFEKLKEVIKRKNLKILSKMTVPKYGSINVEIGTNKELALFAEIEQYLKECNSIFETSSSYTFTNNGHYKRTLSMRWTSIESVIECLEKYEKYSKEVEPKAVETDEQEIKEGDIFYSKNNGDKAIIQHIEMDGFGFGREVVVYESFRYNNDKKKQLWNGIAKFDKQDFLDAYQKEFKHTPIALDDITSHLKQLVEKETYEVETPTPKEVVEPKAVETDEQEIKEGVFYSEKYKGVLYQIIIKAFDSKYSKTKEMFFILKIGNKYLSEHMSGGRLLRKINIVGKFISIPILKTAVSLTYDSWGKLYDLPDYLLDKNFVEKYSKTPKTQKNMKETIGAIINARQINDWTRCADGTYSTAMKTPCRTRGGVHSEQKKITLNNCTDKLLSKYGYKPFSTYLVPLEDIMTDEKTFQNRVNDFSKDSANKIVEAVKSGDFIWEKFDPIILLKHKNYPKLVVLSGHSRTAAFKMLGAKHKVNGLNFTNIPAKIIETDLKTAKDIALNSNTLATPETVIERAIYYRKQLQSGISSKTVQENVKKTELANWTLVWALTFLNERGKTMNALNLLQGKDLTSNENLKQVAYWIGKTRERFNELSNSHEDEMYNYLIKNYGKTFTRLDDFQDKIKTLIIQRKNMFEDFAETALNLEDSTVKSVYKLDYEAQEREIKRELDNLKKDRTKLQKGLASEGESRAMIDKRLKRHDMSIRTLELKLAEHLRKKGQVLSAERNQTALFGFPSDKMTLAELKFKLRNKYLI